MLEKCRIKITSSRQRLHAILKKYSAKFIFTIQRWEYFRLLRWIIAGLVMPIKRINFAAYLLVGVILCGGSGIWLSLLTASTNNNLNAGIVAALCSYATATTGTAFIEFIAFTPSEDRKDFLKGFSVLVSAGVAVLSGIAFAKTSQIAAIASAAVAIFYLWTINADRIKSSPSPTPDGGKGEELANTTVAGHTEGYNT